MHYSFHSTPTCTFKSRNQTITKSNQKSSVPGPADYQVKKPLPQSGTVSTITQNRDLYKKFEANPGPGTYESKEYITEGEKRSMSYKFIDYNKHTPGPQDYDPNGAKVLNKTPVYTLGKRSKSTKQIDFDNNAYKPAPTNYKNSKGDFLNKHGVFIGSSSRKDLCQTQKTPAPNQYMNESAAKFVSSTNPRCKIGEESRKTDFARGEITPGPAVYNKTGFVDENNSKNKGYSCRQKVNDLIAQQISKFPAPGQYEAHLKNKNQAPKYSSALNQRKTFMDDMQSFKKQYPGPGTHESLFSGTKYRSNSVNHFSKSVRQPLDQNEKTPGPVQYKNSKISLLNSAPKFSTTKTVAKNEFLGVNPELPGPGNYDPKLSLVKTKLSISEVPKEKRPDFEKHRHTPGPGFYNLRGNESGPTWKFPSQKRIAFTDNKNQGKDATHYKIPSKVVDPPTYMNVTAKVNFSGHKSMGKTGFSAA